MAKLLHAVRIGTAEVDFGTRRIRANGRERRLQPKVMAVLAFLVAHPGRTCPADEILEAVWGDIGAREQLRTAIWKLRAAMNVEPDGPDVIETIPKLGYRLAVEPVDLSRPRRPRLAIAGAGLFVLAALLAIGARFVRTPAPNDVGAPAATVRPVAGLIGQVSHPSVSPDGSMLAFVSARDSYHTDLFVHERDTDQLRKVLGDDAWNFHPVFDPTGKRLAVFRHKGGQCNVQVLAVPEFDEEFRFPCDGIDQQALTWSEAGDHLISAGVSQQGLRPVMIDMSGEKALVEEAGTLRGRGWAARGDRLAGIASLPSGAQRLVTLENPSGGPTHPEIGAVAWMPDGRTLVYSVDPPDPAAGLWLWDSSAGDPARKWLDLAGRNSQISVDPVGRRVLFDESLVEWALWRGDQGIVTRLGGPADRPASPAVSPDGASLGYLGGPSNQELWIQSLVRAEPARRLDLDQRAVHGFAWLTGDRIVVSVRNEDSLDLEMIDGNGNYVATVAGTTADERRPSFDAMTGTLHYLSSTGGEVSSWRLEREGGPQRIPIPDAALILSSPDSERLYFSRLGEAGIWAWDPSAGEPWLVSDRLAPADWGNWYPAETGVVLLERRPAGNVLVLLDPDTRQMLQALPVPGNVPAGANVSVGPGGWPVAVIRRGFESEILEAGL